MADYTVNNLQELFDACNSINTSSVEEINNIYLEQDIDFNDTTEYWYISSTLFSFTFKIPNQKINIYGNNHSIKNLYIVNGSVFTVNFSDPNYTIYQYINFYDIDFDFVINRNAIETASYVNFIQANINTTWAYNYVSFYNCTFKCKLFMGKSSNANSEFLFNVNNKSYSLNMKFMGCIFSIEYYKISTSFFSFIANCSNTRQRNILNCQFYIKTYLTNNGTESDDTPSFFYDRISLCNTFVIFDIRACSTLSNFPITTGAVALSNTYFVIKKTNTKLTNPAKILCNADNTLSDTNNFIVLDPSAITNDNQVVITNNAESYIIPIQYSNAKNANYLIENLGFIIKGE